MSIDQGIDVGIDQGIDRADERGGVTITFYTLGPPTANPDTGDALVIAGSVQTVFVAVSLKDAVSGTVQDPTAQGVDLAFTDGADPQDGDFAAAAWGTLSGGGYCAAADVAALFPGSYAVYVRTDGYIGRAGYLQIR